MYDEFRLIIGVLYVKFIPKLNSRNVFTKSVIINVNSSLP